jgi:hypothetical protein
MAYRTLGELQAELLARLGMAAMGASGGANRTLIDSFLRNGQAQLYRMQDWKHLTDYFDKELGTSQNLLDYPTEGVMGTAGARATSASCGWSGYGGQYTRAARGHPHRPVEHDGHAVVPDPLRALRPAADLPEGRPGLHRAVWFVADLGARFTRTDDEATLDDEMIFLHALANAKAHYRQPDARPTRGS